MSGEPINRMIYEYARDKTFRMYWEAVRRGIISGGQGEMLMALWLETHEYEPLEEPDESD